MGLPPGKKPKKAKPVETPKPKKDPKALRPKKGKKSKKTAELGEPGEMPQRADLGKAPLIEEQDPVQGNAPVPMTTPRLGDTDPLEGETLPLRPEEVPTPLGTDRGQIDVRVILLPPGLLPPSRQPMPPPEPQTLPKPPMLPGRAIRRQPPGVELHGRERQTHLPKGNLRTRDIPLQADKEAEMEMTALPPVVMERTMVKERTVVMGRTMVTDRTVATKGTVVMGTVQRAMAVSTTAKMEMATMMMTKTSPDTVTSEQAACCQAKGWMPPWKTRLLRPKNCWHPTTCQRCKQEKSKEASSQVSGNPPRQGTVYRSLPEESDTVPERGQKEASAVPSLYPQEGCREGGLTKCGLFKQVMGTGT